MKTQAKDKMLLLGCLGCGSSIVEAALTLAQLPYDYEEANYDLPEIREKLLKVNPLGQVPVLILPSGEKLTESAGIINYIQHLVPEVRLIPSSTSENIQYWRWVAFLIAAIYPSFTYGDFPERWAGAEGKDHLRNATEEWRKKLWLEVERSAKSEESFLSTFSAIDLYLTAMVHWRPRRPWFAENCPKIHGISERVLHRKDLAPIWQKNFGH